MLSTTWLKEALSFFFSCNVSNAGDHKEYFTGVESSTEYSGILKKGARMFFGIWNSGRFN
jgi:hypothetical protein